MDFLRKNFPGNYVMYRPDIRPLVEPLKPNGLVRASEVSISLSGSAVLIKELQNFEETDHGPAHRQENSGVLFPYGKYYMFIMRGEGDISFKCGAVDLVPPFAGKSMEYFRGKLFVASRLLFPAVKFFCLRDYGKLQKGILPRKAVQHPEASAYLSDEWPEIPELTPAP